MSDYSSSSHSNSLQPLLEELRRRAKDEDFGGGPRPRLDEAFLRRFLIVQKGNVEKALDQLKAFYKNVDLHRDFDGEQPVTYQSVFWSGTIGFLNGRSKGRRILVFRVNRWDPSEVCLREIQICLFYHVQYASLEPLTQESGMILVFDGSGISLGHVRQMSLYELRRSISAMQNGLPMKVSQIHCLKAPAILRPLIIFARSLLKEKLRKRFHIHSSTETLSLHIEPEVLPLSLGGQAKDANFIDKSVITKILDENLVTDDFWKRKDD